jgi:hypothetical protein
VARSQISVAINQAGVEAEQLHNSLRSADQDIGNKIQKLANDASEPARCCTSVDEAEQTAIRAACSKFNEASRQF